ncbi:MAG: phosphodiester glycosidase family protein [Actinomycetota bacterium]
MTATKGPETGVRLSAQSVWRAFDMETWVTRSPTSSTQQWVAAVVDASCLRLHDVHGGMAEAELLSLYHGSRFVSRAGSVYLIVDEGEQRRGLTSAERDHAERARTELDPELMLGPTSLRLLIARRALAAGHATLDGGRLVLGGRFQPYGELFETVQARLLTPWRLVENGDPSAWDVSTCDVLIPGALVSETARAQGADLVFNTSFFVHTSADTLSPHSAIGRPFGLGLADGRIGRPPIYPRGALLQREDGTWTSRVVSMGDMRLSLPGGVEFSGRGREGDVAIVTVGPEGTSGLPEGWTALNVVDDRIVGYADQSVPVPQNGMQLRLGPDLATDELMTELREDNRVTYGWDHAHSYVQGVQNGPLLVRDGRPCATEESFEREWFGGDRSSGLHLPSGFDSRPARADAARVGVGVRADGKLVIVAASGVAQKERLDGDHEGVSLRSLAEVLADRGAIEAVNLDGGGSAQMIVGGGQALPTSNRHGLPGVAFERPVPSIGVVNVASDGAPT